MMNRIFATAVAAGVLAALLVSIVEVYTTTPLILKAEVYENAAEATAAGNNGVIVPGIPKVATAALETAAANLGGGFERFLTTLVSNTVAGIAFALLLTVGLTFGSKQADLGKGLLLAGSFFSAFILAPSLSMSPKMPGMPAADLTSRQIWWTVIVVSTLAGLWCLAYGKPMVLKVLGVILMVAPHAWAVPPEVAGGSAPAVLTAEFSSATMVVNALFWALIGLFSAFFYERFGNKNKKVAIPT